MFGELKRRGVLQVGMAYVVTAWLLVQVADVVFPAFDSPEWIMRGLIVLLAIGFPTTLILSWLFDLTSRGLVRTEDVEDSGQSALLRGALLNYVIIGVLAAAVVMFALDKFVWDSGLMPADAPADAIVAVLPFRNISGDNENNSLSFGIHDDLLTQLSKITGFRTISRTSVMRYADSKQPIPEIANELGATVVLEGGVQKSEQRIRVNAQLVEADSDAHLWAETYDQTLSAGNIFAIQSEIAHAIAGALKAKLTREDEARLGQVPTESLPAWEAYSRGRLLMNSTSEQDLGLAIDEFLLATELDSGFSSAWAGLCQAELGRYHNNSERVHFEAAEAACQNALALDGNSVEVHIALGSLYRHHGEYSRAEVSLQAAEYARSEQALETALGLDEMRIEAMVELGLLMAFQNRLQEAEAQLLKAEGLAPREWMVQIALNNFYFRYSDRPDRFERAARHASKAASLRPDLASSWNNVGISYFMLNQYEEAADAYRRSIEIEPSRSAYTNSGLALFYTGQFREATKLQQHAIELAPSDHRAWGRLGDAQYFVEGQRDEAVESYRQAVTLARQSLEVNNHDWRTLGLLSFYLAQLGEDDVAQQVAREGLELSGRNSESLFYLALVHVVAGRFEQSLGLLQEAVRQDEDYRHLIANDPFLQRLSEQEQWATITSG